jgi:hypothetical protein
LADFWKTNTSIMKKLVLSLLIGGSLVASSYGQTTNVIHAWESFLSDATTNIIIVPYGIASTDFKKFGGGLALGYELSQNVVPFLRIENYNGDFFMPSGTVQLQVPIHLGSFVMVPLAYTGIAVPLGDKHINDPVIGIVGTGGALRLGKKFDLLAAYEIRSSVGNQICVGFGWKPNGW